jgi:hypothetical protein
MRHHLAQLNIARLRHPTDHPEIRDFMDGLERINALAEASPGFVWRLKDETGNATEVRHPWSHDPMIIVNLSVWTDPQSLKSFVYRTDHLDFYVRRAEWFERPVEAHYVLWWIPEGHIPTLEEARDRLEDYRRNGATDRAFWFGKLQPAPSAVAAEA